MSSIAEVLMQRLLGQNNLPRSTEFKLGAQAFFNYHLYRITTITPFVEGTASADAFFAGWDAARTVWIEAAHEGFSVQQIQFH